jgi:hypothetical protein
MFRISLPPIILTPPNFLTYVSYEDKGAEDTKYITLVKSVNFKALITKNYNNISDTSNM